MSSAGRARRWAAPIACGASLALAACGGTGVGAAAAASAAGGRTAARAALIARIDTTVEGFRVRQHVPGMTIGVVRGSDTLLLKGFGLANVEDSVPATAATVYRIGSITKQFTAAAVLRLVEQGKIALDAPLATYLPDFPAPGRRVTIRQLLTHTSGIPSYTEVPAFAATRHTDLTDDQLLALVDRRPLDFPPGSEWHYDNSGYYILGVVLQRLTGVPYGDYIERTLARPLGLSGTRYCDVAPIIPHRAAGYSPAGGAVINADYLSMRLPGAAGALCSTAGDLLRWQDALVHGRVVAPATYAQMTTPAVLTNGRRTTYGFALGVYSLHGHPVVEHSGGINGFSTDLAYYPADSVSVVVLLDTDGADAALLARQIAEAVIGMPDAGSRDLPLTSADRTRYVGAYSAPAGRPRVEERDGRLVLVERRPHPLRYQGADRFVPADDHDVQVVFDVVDGQARSLTVTDPDGSAHRFVRLPQ